ncbi:MAG: thioredoxin domain-containing protein [Syntrophales bacterium]|nr:thioredoxin domain-containing protein [Syntrophales bacterium]
MVKRITFSVAFLIISSLIVLAPATAGGEKSPFTTYGEGPVEIRLYSSYFCPPCQFLEPRIEPLLLDLVENKAIRLLFVDIPAGGAALLYVHYYFYALKTENTLERALAVRALLFDAAARRDTMTEDSLSALFNENAVAYETFDVEVLYPRLKELISGDGIRRTPSVVIVRDGESKTFTGPKSIIDAIEALADTMNPEKEIIGDDEPDQYQKET